MSPRARRGPIWRLVVLAWLAQDEDRIVAALVFASVLGASVALWAGLS